VTPFVLKHGAEHPAVCALEVLPLYDAIARVKVHAHRRSDQARGPRARNGAGRNAHGRPDSLVIGVLPGAFSVGWRSRL
jgi:undecaprenyl-diphosphatase